mmetsp:Transcript_27945/g.58715  ORF Transcript_27945/g.58715 Transcript_27945/m.58715 type:complete len:318 (+) Transcript_27945:2132-3085(+)
MASSVLVLSPVLLRVIRMLVIRVFQIRHQHANHLPPVEYVGMTFDDGHREQERIVFFLKYCVVGGVVGVVVVVVVVAVAAAVVFVVVSNVAVVVVIVVVVILAIVPIVTRQRRRRRSMSKHLEKISNFSPQNDQIAMASGRHRHSPFPGRCVGCFSFLGSHSHSLSHCSRVRVLFPVGNVSSTTRLQLAVIIVVDIVIIVPLPTARIATTISQDPRNAIVDPFVNQGNRRVGQMALISFDFQCWFAVVIIIVVVFGREVVAVVVVVVVEMMTTDAHPRRKVECGAIVDFDRAGEVVVAGSGILGGSGGGFGSGSVLS